MLLQPQLKLFADWAKSPLAVCVGENRFGSYSSRATEFATDTLDLRMS